MSNSLKPIGILGINEKGEFVYIPINVVPTIVATDQGQVGVEFPLEGESGIVTQPSPEEDRVAREKAKPSNLTEVLAKHKPKEE